MAEEPAANQEDHHSNDEVTNPVTPVFVPSVIAPSKTRECETKDSNPPGQPDKMKWTDLTMTAATVVMAVATIAIGILAGLQWRDSGKLNKAASDASAAAGRFADSASDIQATIKSAEEDFRIMADSSQKANTSTQAAMKASNAQSRASLDVAIANAQLDQRAWVFVPNFVLSKEPEGDDAISIACGLSNSGKTPALRTTNQYFVGILPVEMPRPDWSKIAVGNPVTVQPQVVGLSFEATYGMPKVVIDAYRAKQAKIWIRAFVEYRDVFNRRHWTEACASHIFGNRLDAFQLCPEDNVTDADVRDNQKTGSSSSVPK